MSASRKHAGRLIKRYGNRKLYDVAASQYITLEGIRALVREGEDVRVVDNDSNEDLTAVTFAQIIFEDAKKQNGDRSLPLFRWLIQRGDEAMRDFFRSVERGREALDSVREATEKKVQQLVAPAKPRRGSFIDELMHCNSSSNASTPRCGNRSNASPTTLRSGKRFGGSRTVSSGSNRA
jgi:polyhydroxyalkanoate synthesis repressor PhaR